MIGPEPARRPGLPATEPASRKATRIGYARVSTGAKKLERQVDALSAAGCQQIFADRMSCKYARRPELKACHASLRPGDSIVVPSLDRYARNLHDLINMVAELHRRGIGFVSLHENLDTTAPCGRLVLHVFAALAEFIRELVNTGTTQVPVDARGGAAQHPRRANEEVIRAARDLLPDPSRSIASIAKLLGISPGTLYNRIPDLREIRAGVTVLPRPGAPGEGESR